METETTTDPQVKVWETDSTHKSFTKADDRRKSLIENGREQSKTVKVRKAARGFMVKVHNGQTRAAPKSKPEPKQIVPTLR
jgi:hypothetical protein